MISRRLVLAAVLAASTIAPGYAQSLGVHGNVYEIQEEDVVGYIKRKLGDYEKSGEIKRRQEAAKEKVRNSMLYPKPVPGITTATQDRVFYYDPTFTMKKTATDAKGRIIVPAGTSINPLQYETLSHKYVFIDARDPKQVDFVFKNFKANAADMVVLTGGSWVELTKKFGRQVYYDQNGSLTRRFAITKVPAVLSQEGLKLRIEEKSL